jgi:hypothetical protein
MKPGANHCRMPCPHPFFYGLLEIYVHELVEATYMP